MSGDEEGFGEELGLLADAMGDCSCEFARELKIAGQEESKFFGGVERIVDVPFELVDEGVLTDCDVEFHENAHVIVLVGGIRQRQVEWVVGEENVWVVVSHLRANAVGDHVDELRLERKVEVLDKLFSEQFQRDCPIVHVPREGVAKLDLVEINIEPNGHQCLQQVRLLLYLSSC